MSADVLSLGQQTFNFLQLMGIDKGSAQTSKGVHFLLHFGCALFLLWFIMQNNEHLFII